MAPQSTRSEKPSRIVTLHYNPDSYNQRFGLSSTSKGKRRRTSLTSLKSEATSVSSTAATSTDETEDTQQNQSQQLQPQPQQQQQRQSLTNTRSNKKRKVAISNSNSKSKKYDTISLESASSQINTNDAAIGAHSASIPQSSSATTVNSRKITPKFITTNIQLSDFKKTPKAKFNSKNADTIPFTRTYPVLMEGNPSIHLSKMRNFELSKHDVNRNNASENDWIRSANTIADTLRYYKKLARIVTYKKKALVKESKRQQREQKKLELQKEKEQQEFNEKEQQHQQMKLGDQQSDSNKSPSTPEASISDLNSLQKTPPSDNGSPLSSSELQGGTDEINGIDNAADTSTSGNKKSNYGLSKVISNANSIDSTPSTSPSSAEDSGNLVKQPRGIQRRFSRSNGVERRNSDTTAMHNGWAELSNIKHS